MKRVNEWRIKYFDIILQMLPHAKLGATTVARVCYTVAKMF